MLQKWKIIGYMNLPNDDAAISGSMKFFCHILRNMKPTNAFRVAVLVAQAVVVVVVVVVLVIKVVAAVVVVAAAVVVAIAIVVAAAVVVVRRSCRRGSIKNGSGGSSNS